LVNEMGVDKWFEAIGDCDWVHKLNSNVIWSWTISVV